MPTPTLPRTPRTLERSSASSTPNFVSSFVNPLPLLRRLARQRPSRMAIKARGRIIFVDPAAVIAVEARGNEVLLQETSGSYTLREAISAITQKLAPHGFVRIHRSVVVNSAFVKEIQPWPTGEYVLRMEGGKEYTVTRTYRKNLKSLADSWIGTCGFGLD